MTEKAKEKAEKAAEKAKLDAEKASKKVSKLASRSTSVVLVDALTIGVNIPSGSQSETKASERS